MMNWSPGSPQISKQNGQKLGCLAEHTLTQISDSRETLTSCKLAAEEADEMGEYKPLPLSPQCFGQKSS